MPPVAAGAVGLALALDRVAGELPERAHPVVWYGRALAPIERARSHPAAVGAAAAVGLPLLAAGAAAGLVAIAGRAGPVAAGVAAGFVLFSTTSLRLLAATASEVVATSDEDLDDARAGLRALCGRDATSLSPGEVRSGAVESLAENLADGLVAPLVGFALLAPWSLPLAAGAAAWVKAVNTGDSMLGYRDEPTGWGFARLDDLVMWAPSRLAAALIALCGLEPGALRRARRWARVPASPNAGWPMATLAVVLGVRLSKPGAYDIGPGADLPTPAQARRGVRVVGRAGGLAFLLAGVVAWS